MNVSHGVQHEPRTVVQLSLINSTGDSYHRMRWPGEHLSAQVPAWRIINLDARAQERFTWGEHADLLVIFQSNDLDLFPLVEKRRRLGRTTLVELNDNFYDAPASAPIASQWSSPVIWQTYERFLTECDGVIVTGPGLRELFASRTTRPIHILENHFPKALPRFEDVWTPPDGSTGLGWAGSIGHLADLLAFEPVIREVLRESPSTMLHLMGNAGIPDWLSVSSERLRFTPWGGMDEYLRFWKPVQIGFVPLLETSCNRCRSDIKAVEMAGCGVLPVLPDALPYQSFLKATGIRPYDSADSLHHIVSEYLRAPERLEADARTCFEYVRNERTGPMRHERLHLYQSLMTAEVSRYAWPLPSGYHETGGTPLAEMSHITLLTRLRTELESGVSPDVVLLQLRDALPDHRFNPDVALAEIRLLKQSTQEGTLERIRHYQQVFPRDLRFRFAELDETTALDHRLPLWRCLLKHLSAQERPIQAFYQSQIVRRLSQELTQLPTSALFTLSETVSGFLRLYPDDAALRFAGARTALQLGSTEQAERHFRWLLESRQATFNNQKFFADSDAAEFATWTNALNARRHGVSWQDSARPELDSDASASAQTGPVNQAVSQASPAPEYYLQPALAETPTVDERNFGFDTEAMQLAMAHLTAGHFTEAWHRFNTIIKAEPSNAVALLQRGLASWSSGNTSDCEADIRHARQLAPHNGLFFDQLAIVQRTCGKLTAAIEASRSAIDLQPLNAGFQLTLADSLSLAGRHAETEAVCRRAVELSANDVDFQQAACHRLAVSLLAQHRHDEAVQILRAALQAPDVKRWQVIQSTIAESLAQTYLEIGVEQGTNLELIRAPQMFGVDPVAPMPRVQQLLHFGVARYFAMTSDQFFSRQAGLLTQNPPDVVFIDGLHTFEQSLRDVENCLQFLSPNGVILMHDCNPTSAVMATPARSIEEVVNLAQQGRLPGWKGQWEGWTGDVWKTIALLRATRSDLRVCVLDCDFGIGVVTRGPATERIDASPDDIAALSFEDLDVQRQELLGLLDPTELTGVLKDSGRST